MDNYTVAKLQLLEPMVGLLYRLVEEGIEYTRTHYENLDRTPSSHMFAHMVRDYVCGRLDEGIPLSVPYGRVPQSLDGIEVTCLGHSVKVLKAENGSLPGAGTYAREAWYDSNNFELFEPDEVIDIRNAVILWDIDKHCAPKDFLFILPAIFELSAVIPYPVTIQRTTEDPSLQVPLDMPEVDQPEDLDIEEDTGTEKL